MKSRPVLVFAAIIACADFDLVAPEPVSPQMTVTIQASHDSGSVHLFSARMLPGRDSSGHAHSLADSLLYVNGTPLEPKATSNGRVLSYSLESLLQAHSSPESLTVRVPTLATTPSAFEILIPVAAREDSFDVRLGAGEDLRLHVSRVIPPQAINPRSQWELRLRRSCSDSNTQFAELRATDVNPRELRLPWDLIELSGLDTLAACFRIASTYGAAGAPYLTSIALIVVARWRVVVVRDTA